MPVPDDKPALDATLQKVLEAVPVHVDDAAGLVHGYLGYWGVVPAATDAVDRALAALRRALA